MLLLRYFVFILLSFSYFNSTIIHKGSFESIGLAEYVEEADHYFETINPIDWTTDHVGQGDEQNVPIHDDYRSKWAYELGFHLPGWEPICINKIQNLFYNKVKQALLTQQIALFDIGYISFLARLYPF